MLANLVFNIQKKHLFPINKIKRVYIGRMKPLVMIFHTLQMTAISYPTYKNVNISKENQINNQVATVTISDEAKDKYYQSLQFKVANKEDKLGKQFQKFYEEYNSAQEIEKRQREKLEKEHSYHRLEDEFSLHVKYHFPKNTLEHKIKEALEGKVVSASLYAAELAAAIRSSVSMSEKSFEERIAYREMALKQAEYIAKNYFNEEEAEVFMNDIVTYYENDVMRDKGYVVIDNSGLDPFKKISSPLLKNGEVSFYELAKRYMDQNDFERFINGEGDPAVSAKFLMQVKEHKEKYNKEMDEALQLDEQQVEELINTTKSMFQSFIWKDGFVTGMEEEQPSFLEEIIKWNNNMLNLFIH